MDENFTKFNSSILNQIYNFINSTDDLLYISGFQGCGKSEIVNKAINEIYNDEILLFRHLCFENSVIDDFLLGFYDTLRYYSINKKINLKKSLTENFAQKVSFYFKNLDKKSLIIIDNFEIIAENSEIMDFLAHLGKYENVKLILISRILNPDFFEQKGLKSKIINILSNDYETFKMKAAETLELYEEADIEELFKQTNGYELYLKMSLRYIQTVNTTLKEFIEEFKKRNLEFDDFLLSKIVSLVPPVYLSFLQNISCLNHSVKISFIEHYGLGDISLVNYLHRKMLISKFDDEIYLKDYLKRYFLNTLSVKEKVASYKKLIEIYNKELAKSPRDRLLRLSRESIRKQIEFIKDKIPNINETKTIKNNRFSYLGQTVPSAKTSEPWYMKLAIEGGKKFQKKETENTNAAQDAELGGLSEEEKKLISDFRKNKAAPPVSEINNENSVSDFILQAEKSEQKYNYKEAIEYLNSGLNQVSDKKTEVKIYLKLAENYIKINDFNSALDSYSKAAAACKNDDNKTEFANIRLLQAKLYKNLYRFNQAIKYLQDVTNSENCAKNTVAKAFLELGEIYENENNFKAALENYLQALDNVDKEQSDGILEAEIYFKIALLYDDGQNPELALEYYKKAVETGKNTKNAVNKDKGFISTSLANSGLIYAELWAENSSKEAFERCVENFEAALKIDTDEENNSGIYFASKQLANVFRNSNPEKSTEYLTLALEAAKKLNDDFKIALSYLEIGDYYYNLQENKMALENYLEARKALGSNISAENNERISVRINDMRVKMDKAEFERVLAEYE